MQRETGARRKTQWDRVVQVTGQQVVLVESKKKTKKEHWMCHEALINKRLDVVVRPHGQAVWQASGGQEVGNTGFVELQTALREEKLRSKVDVRMDRGGRKQRVAAEFLEPVRTAQNGAGEEVGLWGIATRVVVIGADTSGSRDDIGRYALVDVSGSGPAVVKVWFERASGEDLREGIFPVESLCRSTNVDGITTGLTRFR
uniref:Uncharacterized protein n=1 Tax=Mycena chlorophos TaxID=658473 RepID=A0ABQ0KWZ6_MYCCL|nr:predicted protein [Mycena chlorophos]